MESPKFQASFSYQNIIPIIENVLFSIKPLLRKGNIHLTFNRNKKKEIMAIFDPIGIEHVLLNLLQNSIKYTAPGGKIHIDITQKKKEIVIEVIDNGCGISRNTDDIFSPYYRGEKLAIISSGIGLGLSIVKKWIEIHNGSIFYISPLPDKYKAILNWEPKDIGTVFIINLPVSGKKKWKKFISD